MKVSSSKKIGEKISLLSVFSSSSNLKSDDITSISNKKIDEITHELLECSTLGFYPYSPVELVDVEISKKNIVVRTPVKISNAINLNIPEWLLLKGILEKKLEDRNSSINVEILQAIISKINTIIPSINFSEFSNIKLLLLKAIKENKIIKFDYQKRAMHPESRVALPVFLFGDTNHYLVALCMKSNSLRSFRLDSISKIIITDSVMKYAHNDKEKKEFIKKFNEFKTKNESTSSSATILVKNSAYFNLSRQIILKNSSTQSGKFKNYVKCETKIIEVSWFIELIKSYGDAIIIVSPDELKKEFLNDLNNIRIPELAN